MTETNRAWSLLAFGDERQYSGNSGYADDIRDSYQYDNSVPNHKRVRSGDLVLVRDKTRLVGTGIVQSVSSTDGFKDRLRCPVDGKPPIALASGSRRVLSGSRSLASSTCRNAAGSHSPIQLVELAEVLRLAFPDDKYCPANGFELC